MSRPRSESRNALVENAMKQFWVHGYEATSVNDLVKATGVGRGALYSEFGGKRDLFLACLAHYQLAAVGPAFARVEAEGAKFDAIEDFFAFHLSSLEGRPFPVEGCLVSNTLTELAEHDPKIAALVRAHFERLTNGFASALANEVNASPEDESIRRLAEFAVVSNQGIWAFARCAKDLSELRERIDTLLALVKAQLDTMA